MNVIPGINCPDIECVRKRIAVAKSFLKEGTLLHLDVTDGSFTPHRTWADPIEWVKLKAPFGLEVHLMVDRPEEYVDNWLTAGAQRLIVHAESLTPQSVHAIISTARHHNAALMLSSKPSTSAEDLAPYLRHFREFQVLAVEPGPSGQVYEAFNDDKIRFLKEEFPNAIMEVDGGVNPLTAWRVKEIGADTIVSTSYIFGATDPKKAYEELVRI